ncbi:oligosaccharide flippase family protein [Flavobacterium sp. DG2-3]|uniref:oligosaccharide flippase family protein n=1 Tax=Flavobacterium sp. DG2-3 TaxID=3068317 RepID=UPI00273DA3FC|nr:oligosaccharide flippase family protein [Flavobacterium sp. DG2-3]MDP5199626.1 oligosaccharide flippase family protein [Flavobacterium sp. DG2-3]
MFFKLINFKSSLVSNFFSLVILQGANYIFPLLTVPYLFRTLGVEVFGLTSFATAFSQYFIVLTDFGFNLYGVQFISANRDEKQARDVFFVNVLISQILLFVIGLVILVLVIFSFDKFYHNCWLYLLSYTTVFGTVLMPAWFFQGMEQMKYITKINIVTRTLAIIPIFFLVKSDSDYLLVPFFYGLGSITSGMIAIYIVKKKFNVSLKYSLVSISRIEEYLRNSSQFFMSRISVSLYTVSNTFVLGLVGGNMAAGYYSAAEKLYSTIQNVYSPLNGAIYPYMVKHKDLKMFSKIFKAVVLLNSIVLPIAIYYADFIMLLIYKNVASISITVFQVLLGVCLVTIPSILLGYPLLGAFGHSKYTNKTVIISSIFHISGLTILFLTNNITVITVAVLVFLTEFTVLSLRIKGIKKLGLN